MCWRSSTLVTRNSEIKKIPIYKVVLGLSYRMLKAYYYNDFLYMLDHIYEDKIEPEHCTLNKYIIHKGLHCYSAECKFEYNYYSVTVVYLTEARRYSDSLYNKAVIAKGYIPPNTTYYINEKGEIVTESLVLTEIMINNVLEI